MVMLECICEIKFHAFCFWWSTRDWLFNNQLKLRGLLILTLHTFRMYVKVLKMTSFAVTVQLIFILYKEVLNILFFKGDFCTVEFHPWFSGNDHRGIMGKPSCFPNQEGFFARVVLFTCWAHIAPHEHSIVLYSCILYRTQVHYRGCNSAPQRLNIRHIRQERKCRVFSLTT